MPQGGSGHAPPQAVVAVTVAFTILAALAVFTRLITRIVIVRRAGIDDLCITIAFALTIALTACMCSQVHYGMGQHFLSLSPHDITMLLKWFWASVWIYYLALGFTKISILLQYLRVFPHGNFRLACFILMGIIIVYTTCTFFIAIFTCTPVARFWDMSIDGTCLNQTANWFTNTSINILTDLATAILPLPVLSTLQLPKRQKYILMGVFALGGSACLISIIRLQSLYVVSHTNDLTWDNPLPAIWSSTELNVGIISSCLPTLKGCIQRYFPTLFPNFDTRHYSVTLDASNHGADRYREQQGATDHEMAFTEKRLSRTYVNETPRLDEPMGNERYSLTALPPAKEKKARKFQHRDMDRDDDETFDSNESGSTRRLAPLRRPYQVL